MFVVGFQALSTRESDLDDSDPGPGLVQVNTGNYRKAVELFCGLLSIRPGLVGAHLGLGSALALLGGMENAVASFSAAIEVKPKQLKIFSDGIVDYFPGGICTERTRSSSRDRATGRIAQRISGRDGSLPCPSGSVLPFT